MNGQLYYEERVYPFEKKHQSLCGCQCGHCGGGYRQIKYMDTEMYSAVTACEQISEDSVDTRSNQSQRHKPSSPLESA